ncbi:MAG: 50S ribosomal protein L15 [Leptospiraceae bacterium]|nr:50S ribosomal protein L15 [Leptospiraceae bacterium]
MSSRENLNYSSIQPDRKRRAVQRSSEAGQISPPDGSRKERKRVGRGHSTGMGKTSSRGQKGQKARSGFSRMAGFEGGQMPLQRRLPKRGFTNPFPTVYQTVNLYRLERAGVSGELTAEGLQENGFIADAFAPVKILGSGDLKKAIQITADAFSESARKKIEAAGGACNVRDLAAVKKERKRKAAEK